MPDNWLEYFDAYTRSKDHLINALNALEMLRRSPSLVSGEEYLLSEDIVMLDFIIMILRQRLANWKKDYSPLAEESEDA